MRRTRLAASLVLVAAVGVGLSTTRSFGQPPGGGDAANRRITVTGVGTVTIKPDTARVTFTLRATKDSYKNAMTELDGNVKQLEKDIDALKIPNASLKMGPASLTATLTDGPEAKPGGPADFTVSRSFIVTIPGGATAETKTLVASADRVLAIAVDGGAVEPRAAGGFGGGGGRGLGGGGQFPGGFPMAAPATRVELIRADMAGVRKDALKLAVADAVVNGKAIAGTAELNVKDVVTVTDTGATLNQGGYNGPYGYDEDGGFYGGPYGGRNQPRTNAVGETEFTITVRATFSY